MNKMNKIPSCNSFPRCVHPRLLFYQKGKLPSDLSFAFQAKSLIHFFQLSKKEKKERRVTVKQVFLFNYNSSRNWLFDALVSILLYSLRILRWSLNIWITRIHQNQPLFSSKKPLLQLRVPIIHF